MTNDLIFQTKANRDARYRELVRAGRPARRSSIRNQSLHPQYVADFSGPERFDTGIGNGSYRTFFPVLYRLEF